MVYFFGRKFLATATMRSLFGRRIQGIKRQFHKTTLVCCISDVKKGTQGVTILYGEDIRVGVSYHALVVVPTHSLCSIGAFLRVCDIFDCCGNASVTSRNGEVSTAEEEAVDGVIAVLSDGGVVKSITSNGV